MFNTGQCRQFTRGEFIQTLQEHRVNISITGKAHYGDNILVERLWRTLEYEKVYLKPTPPHRGTESSESLLPVLQDQRPHQSLGYVRYLQTCLAH